MEEQLITFDTAKLAKLKGFDIHSNEYYYDNLKEKSMSMSYDNKNPNHFCCPTQSLLQKWLRETHNIHIEVKFQVINFEKYMFLIWQKQIIDEEPKLICVYHETKENSNRTLSKNYNSYEDALETALYEALNLV